jgi:hypothetical protein
MQFNNIINKYKFPIIIITVYFIFTILTWGKWGDFVYDTYREAIIPQAVLEGKVIYKDITCMYPPLVYYFHAFLYYIFGQSLNVLYFAAISITLLIYGFLYYIIKIKSSDITAFLSVFSIMCALSFRIQIWHAVSSWYLPYSYAIMYSLLFIVISFVFLVLYLDKKIIKYLYLSLFFAGLSAAFKFDFLIFIIIPLFFVIKTKSIKNIIFSVLFFLIPIFITFLLFLLNGGSCVDLIDEYHLMMNFYNSPNVKAYNTSFIPLSFNYEVWMYLKSSLLLFFKIIIPFIILCIIFQSFISKIKNLYIKIFLFIIEICLILVLFIYIYPMQQILDLHSNFIFLPYIVCLCLIIILFKKRIDIKNNKKELFFILLVFTAILISNRNYIAPYISNVGNYNIIFYVVSFVYFCTELLPQYIKFGNKNCIKNIIVISLMAYFATYAFNFYNISKNLDMKLYENNKGVLYIDGSYYYQYKEIEDYIKKNTSVNDSVLLVPEYLVINYFTGRKIFNYKYYNIILHVLDMYGEQNILEDIKKNPPDYYVWTDNLYAYNNENWYLFGIDYAQDIHKYFTDNYDIVKEIYNDDDINKKRAVIYKKKNI